MILFETGIIMVDKVKRARTRLAIVRQVSHKSRVTPALVISRVDQQAFTKSPRADTRVHDLLCVCTSERAVNDDRHYFN